MTTERQKVSQLFSDWYNRTVARLVARLSRRVCFQNIYAGETSASFSRLTVILASLYQICTVDKGIFYKKNLLSTCIDWLSAMIEDIFDT